MSNSFVTPWTVTHRLLCPWDFPGKNTISFSFLKFNWQIINHTYWMNFDIVYNCETITEIKIMNISITPQVSLYPTCLIPPCCFPILPYLPILLPPQPETTDLLSFTIESYNIYSFWSCFFYLLMDTRWELLYRKKLHHLGVNCMSGTKGRNQSRITWRSLFRL